MSAAALDVQSTPQGITYLDTGPRDSSTAIVCVHGWACDAFDYTYLFNELLKPELPVRAIAVNLPGHGTTSPQHYASGSVSEMANAILTLLQELSINDVILVGHSMGVRVITETWTSLQRRQLPNVRGMVFLDGSHYKLRKTLFAFDPGDARSKDLTRDDKISGMIGAFKRMFSPRTPEQFQESTLNHLRTMDLEYSEKVRKGFVEYDRNELDAALELLGECGTPLLSFQSTDVDDENQRIPLTEGGWSRWMQFLQEKVPQAQQLVVADSMHFPHVDQPRVVADGLREFLKESNLRS